MGEKAGISSSNSENRWESKGVTCPFVVDQLSEMILWRVQSAVRLLSEFSQFSWCHNGPFVRPISFSIIRNDNIVAFVFFFFHSNEVLCKFFIELVFQRVNITFLFISLLCYCGNDIYLKFYELFKKKFFNFKVQIYL